MRQDVVDVARQWIGTPYRHQASCKGAGTDCLGLVLGVWRTLYGDLPEALPGYTEDWSEPSGDETMWRAAARHLIPMDDPLPSVGGDVLLFRMRSGKVAKHCGIAALRNGRTSFIHAYSGHSVVESALTAPWARRVVARFQFPKKD